MFRSVLRSTARSLQQQSSRRFISSSQNFSYQNYNKSKWIAGGVAAFATSGLLLSGNPISSDAEGKDVLPEDAKVVVPPLNGLVAEPVAEAAKEPAAKVAPAEGEEAEGDRQAAYNPETGEINWDCPCLGGMAHGPCGEEFKEAFSCFIYSELEPKGIDCIEKFKNMQNCFRQYPEVYSEELRDEDEDTVIEVAEDDKGNVVTDVVTVETQDGEVVAVDEKIIVDVNDVDEFIKQEPNSN